MHGNDGTNKVLVWRCQAYIVRCLSQTYGGTEMYCKILQQKDCNLINFFLVVTRRFSLLFTRNLSFQCWLTKAVKHIEKLMQNAFTKYDKFMLGRRQQS